MVFLSKGRISKITTGLLVITFLLLLLNNLQLGTINKIAELGVLSGAATSNVNLRGGAQDAATGSTSKIIPTGVPNIYGKELGVSFDDVSAYDQQKADLTIGKLGSLDQSITLSGAEKERYIQILYYLNNGISCEYCCGARSIIFESGEAACGCAHSYAMRGLAKYLITKHGDEFTDEQIMEELGKWKVLFFPGVHEAKAQVLASQGIEFNYINLASNKYRGIEKGAGSGAGAMVGGC